jgi:hypothetical protein
MSCNREEFVFRCIDDDLNPRETVDFNNHLSACPECRITYHEILGREKAVREIVTRSFPVGTLAEKVMRRIDREAPNLYPLPRPMNWWKWVAPVLVPMLALWMFLIRPATKPENPTSGVTSIPTGQAAAPRLAHLATERPGWNRIHDEFVGVYALAENTWVAGKLLPAGRIDPVESLIGSEFRGSLEFIMGAGGKNRARWDGSGLFSFTNDMIIWEKGKGDFAFSLSSPVTVQIGEIGLRIVGTRIHIEGDVTSQVRVEVLSGRVFYSSPAGSGYLKNRTVMAIEKNEIAQAFGSVGGDEPQPGTLHPPVSFSSDPGSPTYGHLKDPDRETSGRLPSHGSSESR